MRRSVLAALLATLVAAPAADAAVLSFDLGALPDVFVDFGSTVAGGFDYDTTAGTFSRVAIEATLGTYGDGTGMLFADTAGLGFPNDIFSFDNGSTTFFFSIAGLNLADPPAGAATFDDVFAFESDAVAPDFSVDPFASTTFYVGPVTVRTAIAAVPLPATLPMLLAGLAGVGALRRRRSA